MKKRILSLILALLLFAAVPAMAAPAAAAPQTVRYTVGADTMKGICQKMGLDYDFCWRAIISLNPGEFDAAEGEDAFQSMVYGSKILLPKTNADAAEILGVSLPARLSASTAASSSSADTFTYTVKSGDTVIGICNANGLDFAKCKAAIMKLNGFPTDYSFLTLKTGDKLTLPKSNDAAVKLAASTATTTTTTTTTNTAANTTTTTTTTALPSGNAVAAYMIPHVVQAGETIYGICQANGVDFNKYFNLIMQASGVTYATGLHVGDIVYIPSATSASGAFSIVSHTVRTGETTIGICQDLGVNYADNLTLLTALNPGKNLSNIHTGDILLIPRKA